MSGGRKVSVRKATYYARIIELLNKFDKILLVTADNIGSNQMQKIRKQLRGRATLLMGKNTLMRKAMREVGADKPSLNALTPHLLGNCGMVFVHEDTDLGEVREVIKENKVGAYAKVGSLSPCKVIVPAGNTGMDPGKTSFFQALSIQTKINRGKIEIVNDIPLLQMGDKVGNSQAVLLQMLDIKPFEYFLKITSVFDKGSIYSPEILDLTDADILNKFRQGVQRIAALGTKIGYPTIASVPYSVQKSFENLMCISIATEYTFKQTEEIKALLSDPEALAKAQAAAASATAASGGAAAEEEEKPEEGEDVEGGMGDLFGGGGSDSDEDFAGGMFGGGSSSE